MIRDFVVRIKLLISLLCIKCYVFASTDWNTINSNIQKFAGFAPQNVDVPAFKFSPGDVLQTLLNRFESDAIMWQAKLAPFALSILYAGLTLNLLRDGIFYILEESDTPKFIMMTAKQLVSATIFYFWMYNPGYLPDIVKYIMNMGKDIGGISSLDASSIIDQGWEALVHLIGGAYNNFQGAIVVPLVIVAAIFGILIAIMFVKMAMDFLMINIELFIVYAVGGIVLGLAGSLWTTDYAVGYLRYFISASLRALIMVFILSVCIGTYTYFFSKFSSIANDPVTFITIGSAMMITTMITMILVGNASSLVNAITTGKASNSSGGAVFSAITAAAATTMAMASIIGSFAKGSYEGGVGALFNGGAGTSTNADGNDGASQTSGAMSNALKNNVNDDSKSAEQPMPNNKEEATPQSNDPMPPNQDKSSATDVDHGSGGDKSTASQYGDLGDGNTKNDMGSSMNGSQDGSKTDFGHDASNESKSSSDNDSSDSGVVDGANNQPDDVSGNMISPTATSDVDNGSELSSSSGASMNVYGVNNSSAPQSGSSTGSRDSGAGGSIATSGSPSANKKHTDDSNNQNQSVTSNNGNSGEITQTDAKSNVGLGDIHDNGSISGVSGGTLPQPTTEANASASHSSSNAGQMNNLPVLGKNDSSSVGKISKSMEVAEKVGNASGKIVKSVAKVTTDLAKEAHKFSKNMPK